AVSIRTRSRRKCMGSVSGPARRACRVPRPMLDIDAILRPWWVDIAERHGPLSLFDVHTHIGFNDPDGFKQSPEELMRVMEAADARAVVFPMHEPDGYPAANDVAIAAAASSDGRLRAFCRIDP